MNEILLKRIEEAVKKTACPQCVFYVGGTCYNDDDCKLFDDFVGLMTFALQNQWISVEEALPEVDGHGYSKPVLVKSDTNELLVATYSKTYNKWNAVDPVSYHRLVITHWMQIPSLEGGEK